MEKTDFAYKAFISYTSRDSRTARKLEEWLIHFSEHLDGDRKYKFFRDSSYSDAGKNVEEDLKRRLKESEWLILVCSPYINEYKGPERNWVDFECGYYAYGLGRKDHILCILSDSAPSGRDISPFYPESIRDLRETLAADMRGGGEWGREAGRIYAGITGRRFEDVYSAASAFYWESQYRDILSAACQKNREGKNHEALRLMSEIPEKYNPGRIEWDYVKALCSRSAYPDCCGSLNLPAGTKIICYDRKTSHAYSTDGRRFFIINCLTAAVIPGAEAHDGRPFRFFYMGEGNIGTFDELITVKLWKYDRENITLICRTSMEIPFPKSEPEAFRAFYPDCRISHMPAAYHDGARLLALTARSTLFLLDMETMEYQTMDIPPLKKYLLQLSGMWKNPVFSENADMLFLTDENSLLGWSLNTGGLELFWNRKRCQPSRHAYSAGGIFQAENTACSICLSADGRRAEWKENNTAILCFEPIPHERLNSIHTADKSPDYLILLYEKDIVQVLKRNAGVVYMENVPVDRQATGQDFPEMRCPAALRHGELWHLPPRRLPKPLYDENGQQLLGNTASCGGIYAVCSRDRKSIYVYSEYGQLLAEKEICAKKQPEMLSDEEMHLAPGIPASELLKNYVRRNMDPEIYECSTYAFIDQSSLFIGCTKGYLYLWETDRNALTKLVSIHRNDISIVQAYQQHHTVVTTDTEGLSASWHYERNTNGLSLRPAFTIHTHQKHIMVQLMSEHELAVFCNDTGELILYDCSDNGAEKAQTLLSAETAAKENIKDVLSMYVTHDRSRLVICRPKEIVFVRLPDGKVMLESEIMPELNIHGDLKGLKICDDEQKIELAVKDACGNLFTETLDIAGLTEPEYERRLQARRRRFFSAATT